MAPQRFDGSQGNLLSRTEPKVRAAGVVALLTPVVLYYLTKIPAVAALPGALDALIIGLVTGGLAWAAGFLTRAVDRIDLFAAPEVAAVRSEAERIGDHLIGHRAVDEVESFISSVGGKFGAEVGGTLAAAANDVASAAALGQDPLVAARALEPSVLAALQAAGASVPASVVSEVATLEPSLPAAGEAVTTELPAVGALLPPVPGAAPNPELADALRHLLSLVEPGATPIADAVAAEHPTAQDSLPPVPPAGAAAAVPAPVAAPVLDPTATAG